MTGDGNNAGKSDDVLDYVADVAFELGHRFNSDKLVVEVLASIAQALAAEVRRERRSQESADG